MYSRRSQPRTGVGTGCTGTVDRVTGRAWTVYLQLNYPKHTPGSLECVGLLRPGGHARPFSATGVRVCKTLGQQLGSVLMFNLLTVNVNLIHFLLLLFTSDD